MVSVISRLVVAGTNPILAAVDRLSCHLHGTTGYKYACFNHMMLHIMLDAKQPGAPSLKEPLMWDSSQPCKSDACHTTCVMLTFVELSDWTPQGVYALNSRFKEEFGLRHDIKWIGMVAHEKAKGFSAASCRMYSSGSAGWNLAFLVHKDDRHCIENAHCRGLGFRWFFDVVSGMPDRFPPAFVNMYDR
jgi:hypothetical protein